MSEQSKKRASRSAGKTDKKEPASRAKPASKAKENKAAKPKTSSEAKASTAKRTPAKRKTAPSTGARKRAAKPKPVAASVAPVEESTVRLEAYFAYERRVRNGTEGDEVSDWFEALRRLGV